jgi:hypothetical protein
MMFDTLNNIAILRNIFEEVNNSILIHIFHVHNARTEKLN